MVINTSSAKETISLGRKFAKLLKDRDVLLLEGDLGGGKTTFVKGVLEGMGCKQKAVSPSFTLVRQYKIKKGFVYHIDLYRLARIADIFSLGIEDYLYSKGSLVLIEWGEKIEQTLDCYIKLKFSFIEENSRKITVSSKGYDKTRIKAL